MPETNTQSNPKRMQGTVVGTGMDKTVRVKVDRYEKHPKYLKYVKKNNQFLAHDEEEAAEMGDRVEIEETKPISKNKSFRVVTVNES